MKNSSFCHLHVHDQYSLLDGYGSAKNYAKRAREMGFKYLGLTNHGNIDGFLDFQKECKKNEIKPIFGCEAYIVPDMNKKEKGEKRGHITFLIKNETGFQNLLFMLTVANTEGFYYKPRFDYDLVLNNLDGLVIMTACANSFLHIPGGEDFFCDLYDAAADLYLEIMPHDYKYQIENAKVCHELYISGHEGIKLIATNDCHYIYNEDSKTQEILLAIQNKAKWQDKKRWKFDIDGLYLRSIDEMIIAFQKQSFWKKIHYLKAIRNTLEIAKKCSNFEIKQKDILLPLIDDPEIKKYGEKNFLRVLCLRGARVKNISLNEKYKERMREELNLIQKKNFERYFLIVWELLNWCKKNGIMYGPGRGSVGGSLVAYLIGITAVDPIKFDLIFSRFIAEDRIDYPDIDLDFEDVKRSMIRKHLQEMYGEDNIAGVSTFLTLKGRAAIRDVGRVFDIKNEDVNRFAKTVDKAIKGGEEDVILKAGKTKEGNIFKKRYPDVFKEACKLEGQVRGAGQHAAAIIVSSESLRNGNRCSLSVRSKNLIVNWSKDDAEYMGLMKLDILGLSMLSILNDTREMIKINYDKDIVFEDIALDDKKVLRMISQGYTAGIFQLNAWATTRLCQDAEISTFKQISDIIALVRPGPYESGVTEEFVKRKKGRKWESKHEIYEKITKDTFGLVIYQEQIMEVISKVAGLSYSTADKIRKIIGKKRDVKKFKPFEKQFIEGCLIEGIFDKKEALEFWKLLQSHAHYSFNKAHSVEYALISYWTAWCKYYYPAEFLCSSLTYVSDDKKGELITEAYRLGLSVLTPKVGYSDPLKWRAKEKVLHAPFISIKGIGDKMALKASVLKPRKIKQRKGFFSGKNPKLVSGKTNKIEKMLIEICAFDIDAILSQEAVKEYFSFKITGGLATTLKDRNKNKRRLKNGR